MLSVLRNNKLTGYLWVFVALYMLNISVDATDSLYCNQIEDVTINNQESIIEIVVEKVLGYENAIKEYNDNDNQQTTSFKKIKLVDFVFENSHKEYCNVTAVFKNKKSHQYYYNSFSTTPLEITIPPPKV